LIVYDNGKKISLTQNDFITKGGEGEVYGKGSSIYKIYHDRSKMIANGKILELKNITDSKVIVPLNILSNSRQVDVGFTMDWIKKTISICKLFTNDFRNMNNISDKMAIDLINVLRNVINNIHSKKCLIVDLNELNILVDTKFQCPYFIDVDSYQTPSYPATAIMPYVKDHQTKGFNENTDWFSFAILTCQLLIGIHPYKGKHSQYNKKELIKRMKENASIFGSNIRLPSAVRDFNVIPDTYLEWFQRLFENGVREAPPENMGKLIPIVGVVKVISSVEKFIVKEIMNLDFSENILYYKRYENKNIVKGSSKIQINKKEHTLSSTKTELVIEENTQMPIFVHIDKGILSITNELNLPQDSIQLRADDMMVVGNSVFLQYNNMLSEVRFKILNNTLIKTVRSYWNIMPNSSEMFSGLVYQSILGKPYLMIPVPTKKSTQCHVIPISELEDYKIIEAKHDSQVVQIICFKDGMYDRVTIVFSEKYDNYSLRTTKDVDYKYNNFIVLENGVVASIVEDGQMEIYFNNLNNTRIRVVDSKDIRTSMLLMKDGITVLFAEGTKLYSMKLKT